MNKNNNKDNQDVPASSPDRKEAGRLLGVHPSTVRRLEKEGRLTPYKDARNIVRYDRTEIEKVRCQGASKSAVGPIDDPLDEESSDVHYGILSARAFKLFDEGKHLVDTVQILERPLRLVRKLRADYVEAVRGVMWSGAVRKRLEQVCGCYLKDVPDFADGEALVKLMEQTLPLAVQHPDVVQERDQAAYEADENRRLARELQEDIRLARSALDESEAKTKRVSIQLSIVRDRSNAVEVENEEMHAQVAGAEQALALANDRIVELERMLEASQQCVQIAQQQVAIAQAHSTAAQELLHRVHRNELSDGERP